LHDRRDDSFDEARWGKFNPRIGKNHGHSERVKTGAMRDRGDRSSVVHRHVAAFVVAPAHVAITRHLLAALHFGGGHGRIRKTGQQRRSHPEEGNKDRNRAAATHFQILPHF
jgi:hypothetical protein